MELAVEVNHYWERTNDTPFCLQPPIWVARFLKSAFICTVAHLQNASVKERFNRTAVLQESFIQQTSLWLKVKRCFRPTLVFKNVHHWCIHWEGLGAFLVPVRQTICICLVTECLCDQSYPEIGFTLCRSQWNSLLRNLYSMV